LKEKKTALTSTWKNLPLEATKNSKKLKKNYSRKEKRKKAQSNQHQSIFEYNKKKS